MDAITTMGKPIDDDDDDEFELIITITQTLAQTRNKQQTNKHTYPSSLSLLNQPQIDQAQVIEMTHASRLRHHTIAR